MDYKSALSYITTFSCTVALQIPAYNVMNSWNISDHNKDLKLWLIIATVLIDLIIVQWYFLIKSWPGRGSLYLPNLPKLVYVISIPTYALLIHSSAVLNDSFYRKQESGEILVKYRLMSMLSNLISLCYGLTMFLIVITALTSRFENQIVKKISAFTYAFALIGMALYYSLNISIGTEKVEERLLVWVVFAVIIVIIFSIALVSNMLISSEDNRILFQVMGWGSAPTLYWTFRGYLLYNNLLESTGGQYISRHPLASLLKLVIWTIVPTVAFAIGGIWLFTMAKLGYLTPTETEISGNKKKLILITLYLNQKVTLDVQNPEQKEDLLKNLKSTECTVCWESFKIHQELLMVDGCKHHFHKACLYQWVEKDPRCPLCRANIDTSL